MAAKKKTRRPPRTVWLVVNEDGFLLDVELTRKRALAGPEGSRPVGPYVLAERVREK